MKSICLLLAVTFLFSGCATIINSSRQDVVIRSVPPGASVFVNDSLYGRTPMTMHMKRKLKTRTVKLSMDGYDNYDDILLRKLDGWFFGNILIGGLIGMGIDALSGGMYRITPGTINANLTQKQLNAGSDGEAPVKKEQENIIK